MARRRTLSRCANGRSSRPLTKIHCLSASDGVKRTANPADDVTMSARFLAFVGMVFAACCGRAQAPSFETNVMGFQHFEQSGGGLAYVGKCVREGGMILSTLSAEGLSNDFVAWRTNDSCYRGSAALANSHSYGTTVLSRTNGMAFDFIGIDLSGFQAFHQGTVTFYGFRSLACVASESFTYAGGRFQTFRTSRLTNVTEIRWDQNAAATPQFDNLTVAFEMNVPVAQPVIHLRHGPAVRIDIAGLMVDAAYALEHSADSKHWIQERTFRSSSTINFPGFISSAASPHRFYRVRGL